MNEWNKEQANAPESDNRDHAETLDLETEREENEALLSADPVQQAPNAPKSAMPAWPWIVVSVVAVAALAVVLIINPMGGSKEKLVKYDGGALSKADFYEGMEDMLFGDQISQMVDSVAENKLVKQLADKAGIAVTDDQLDKEVTDFAGNFGGMEALQQALDQQGISMDELKQKQVAPTLLRKLLYQNQNPATDAVIQAYADENKDAIAAQKKVRASHILVATKEEADAIEADLKAGQDFAELAKSKSTDTGSAVNGGDLDYFGSGQMVPEFEEAAFKLKVGEVSEPVKSDFGYHIIKVTDIQEPDVQTLYWQEQLNTNGTTWMDKLKADNHWEKIGEKKDAQASPSVSPEASPSASASATTE
ncbi:foldase protein PrsA [Cohnella panacarvi]|uniref:foldase protein PrsA n=1 Tax=Cohnella panacarvi TaxID=400776 RepID=UPI00047C5E32|nr:peptidylprolyl isomerase [Cohnella panacarvi]